MIIPLRIHRGLSRFAFLTLLFVVSNVAAYLLSLNQIDGHGPEWLQSGPRLDIINGWGAIPREIFSMDPMEWSTLFTSCWIHGGWDHLIGNLLFLLPFGRHLEDALGLARFAILYLAGGVVASITYAAAAPGSPVPLIGASGAISAVMGAWLLVHPRVKATFYFIPISFWLGAIRLPAWLFLAGWIGFNIYMSQQPGGNTAWWAHIGGFSFGIILGIIYRLKGKKSDEKASEQKLYHFAGIDR